MEETELDESGFFEDVVPALFDDDSFFDALPDEVTAELDAFDDSFADDVGAVTLVTEDETALSSVCFVSLAVFCGTHAVSMKIRQNNTDSILFEFM